MLRAILSSLAAARATSTAKQFAREVAAGLIVVALLIVAAVFVSIAAYVSLSELYGSAWAASIVAAGAAALAGGIAVFVLVAPTRKKSSLPGLSDAGLSLSETDRAKLADVVAAARDQANKIGPAKLALIAGVIGFVISKRI